MARVFYFQFLFTSVEVPNQDFCIISTQNLFLIESKTNLIAFQTIVEIMVCIGR
jgi:hypothetical protein